MDEASFVRSELNSSLFESVSLRNARFSPDTNLCLTTFRKCQMENVSFEGNHLIMTLFVTCSLTGSIFRTTKLERGATFKSCDLTRADFSKSNFWPVGFSNVTFRRCNMRGALFRGAKECCAFIGSDLRGVDFTSARFIDVYFNGCDLRGAIFSNAYLYSPVFIRCDLRGADFSRAVFPPVCNKKWFRSAEEFKEWHEKRLELWSKERNLEKCITDETTKWPPASSSAHESKGKD